MVRIGGFYTILIGKGRGRRAFTGKQVAFREDKWALRKIGGVVIL